MTITSKKEINGKSLIYWLVITVCLTITTVLFIFTHDYQERTAKISQQKHNLMSDDIRAEIKFFDESLSMSARLFAITGDEKWKNRYTEHEKQLKLVLKKADNQNIHSFNNMLFKATELANKDIKAHESSILAQKDKNTKNSQTSPLFNANYLLNKQHYALRINYYSNVSNNAIRLNQLKSQISYIDEVLTMSARMAAFTGDNFWKERYDRMVVILDASIAEALTRTDNKNLASILTEVSKTNDTLIAFEERAFELVALKELTNATNVLFGHDYQIQKNIYAAGMEKFSLAINEEVEKSIENTENEIKIKAIIVFITLLIFTLFILYLAKRIKIWEQILERRNTELEKKKNELEIFSYSMSHDLKAPLKSIQGFAKRIEKFSKRDNYTNIETLNQHVILNAEKLDKLVDDIMEIIKAEKINDLVEEVDFNLIANDISNDIDLLENIHRVKFTAKFNHNYKLFCQRHSLYQILINLVTNAVKYAKDDIDDSFVKLETTMQTKELLKITVSDNGIGINESMHDRVFTMFFRESSNRSFGTGLGLYLVKKQVENMEGTITFESNEHGSSFSILLPLQPNK